MKLELKPIERTSLHFMALNLKEVLAEKKITQAELARISGVSRAYISDVCNGRRYLTKPLEAKLRGPLK